MEGVQHLKKYTFSIIFLIAVIISILLVKSFIIPIIAGAVIAYIFYPLFKKINSKLNRKTFSAIIISLLIIIIIVLFIGFIINSITKEIAVIYLIMEQKLKTGAVFDFSCSSNSLVCDLLKSFGGSNINLKLFYYIELLLRQSQGYLLEKTTALVFAIPEYLIDIFITFFFVFFLLRDGNKLVQWFNEIMPLKEDHKKHIFEKMDETIYAILYGLIMTAIIQGIIGGIGFALFGIPSPIIWGVLMAFFALIPYIGTPIIWGPASLILMLQGYAGNDTWLLAKGIGLLVYGALFISTIDNIIKPKLIGDKIKIHPAVILLGLLGGLKLFGIIGVVIGPLILALTVNLFEIYKKED